MHTPCPCGSTKSYDDCCGIFHQKRGVPATAEALMRSRYSAFALKLEGYLWETHHPSKRKENSLADLRQTSENTRWIGLTLLKTEQGGAQALEGRVSFAAKYEGSDGKEAVLYENSRFVKEQGRWYYLDGSHEPGRNDPCWCGSGKKFKKCHG